MVADRTELNKSLAIDRFFPPFFSVLLPELGRPQYVTKCIDSILKYADMPVEMILHDDGSGIEKQNILWETLRDKISTFVFDMGYNTGLARAMNRCRAMASSNYLIGFNTDVYVTSSFLNKMKTALDLPYVGIVNVTEKIGEGPGVHIAANGTKIAIVKNMGICHCFGIKTSTWDSVGGWDENVQTTASDVGFTGSIFGKGYITVLVEGTTTNEMWPVSEDGKTNIDGSNPNYIDSCCETRSDNNVPPIFGMPIEKHDRCCEERRSAIWHGVNDAQNADLLYPQWYNHRYQCDQLPKFYLQDGTIDWEFGAKYGFNKWKDRIIKDFNLQ